VQLRETEDAVRKLNIQVQVVTAQTSDEFERPRVMRIASENRCYRNNRMSGFRGAADVLPIRP
jgi:hypothetical protein